MACNSLTRKENVHTYPCKQCKTQDRLRVSTPTKQNTSDEPTGRVSEELAPDHHYRSSEEGQTPATARDPKSLQTSRCRVNWVHVGVGRLAGALIGRVIGPRAVSAAVIPLFDVCLASVT
jgi:hypothetical protein